MINDIMNMPTHKPMHGAQKSADGKAMKIGADGETINGQGRGQNESAFENLLEKANANEDVKNKPAPTSAAAEKEAVLKKTQADISNIALNADDVQTEENLDTLIADAETLQDTPSVAEVKAEPAIVATAILDLKSAVSLPKMAQDGQRSPFGQAIQQAVELVADGSKSNIPSADKPLPQQADIIGSAKAVVSPNVNEGVKRIGNNEIEPPRNKGADANSKLFDPLLKSDKAVHAVAQANNNAETEGAQTVRPLIVEMAEQAKMDRPTVLQQNPLIQNNDAPVAQQPIDVAASRLMSPNGERVAQIFEMRTAMQDQVAKTIETEMRILNAQTIAVKDGLNPNASRSIILQLQPVGLGRIHAQIAKTGENVNVQMIVEKADTYEMLKADVDALKMTLRGLGMADAEITMTQGSMPSRQNDQQNAFSSNGNMNADSNAEADNDNPLGADQGANGRDDQAAAELEAPLDVTPRFTQGDVSSRLII